MSVLCTRCAHLPEENPRGVFLCEPSRNRIVDRENCSDFLDATSIQSAKQDAGKPRISLVPPAIIRIIAKIREYGTKKYGNPENWRNVEIERYWDAFLRHVLSCFGNLKAVDRESGFPHLYHVACNLAFILEIMDGENDEEKM